MRYLPDASRLAAAVEALAQSHVWTREELAAFRARRLRAVVRHAARHVPYYRRLFAEAGLTPADIQSPADLHKIPVTTRSELQRHPLSELVAEGVDPARLVLHATSGTSGEPLCILRTPFEEYLLRAFRLKEQILLGLRPTDRRCGTGGLSRRPASLERAPRHALLSHVFGSNPKPHPGLLSPDQVVLAYLREAEPDVLVGSASSLAWLAGLLAPDDPIRMRLRYVETAGETCTTDMRDRIVRGFGVPLFDIYASHEFNILASECPATGAYHVTDWNLILEVMNGDRPASAGEQGEAVVTGLHSFAMPFLRYRLNDLVIRGAVGCACGAPVSTLHGILGRTIEMFHLPGGGKVHPYALLRPLVTSAPWLRRYQIVQDRLDHVSIKVVADGAPGADSLARTAACVAGALGGQVAVDIAQVREIPTEANGKFRAYYSLVAAPESGPSSFATVNSE